MIQRASSITLMVTITFSLLIQVTLAAPCKLKIDVPKPTKLISGIIDQFKIEKIAAELEILS
ncbi:hypothetical protein LOAG_19245 [Loa loa]|uniref:Uncharacterized protein n=1 Tax=Loa loa TaxID=7209 RepID=A0A1S0UCQ1_LOALO|nr:hypothetical protein LOAG_19245 [Loa loa]EJD73333.1 hypothetical protein LOAG_19245 [Loa loa]